MMLYVLGMITVLVLAFQDLKTRKVNILPAIGVIGVAVIVRLCMQENILDLGASICVGLIFVCLTCVTSQIGLGDGIIIAMVMVCLGFTRGIQVICLSFLLISLLSLILYAMKKADKKTVLPYVPWLGLAYIAGGIWL